jgi:cytochrome bd-type quinol oxidase subunit 2
MSMEFGGRQEGVGWQRFWDTTFFGASRLATFLFGL